MARRFVGHDRYVGQVAGRTPAHLNSYGALPLYVGFSDASFNLIDKTRDGSFAVERSSPPAPACS